MCQTSTTNDCVTNVRKVYVKHGTQVHVFQRDAGGTSAKSLGRYEPGRATPTALVATALRRRRIRGPATLGAAAVLDHDDPIPPSEEAGEVLVQQVLSRPPDDERVFRGFGQPVHELTVPVRRPDDPRDICLSLIARVLPRLSR
jgi:hypothetical protein